MMKHTKMPRLKVVRPKDNFKPVLEFSKPVKIIGGILLALIVVSIFLPIIFTMLYSVFPSGLIPNIQSIQDIVDNVTFQGYQDVFRQLPFVRIIGNSIFVSLVSTVLQVMVSFMAAYALTHWDYPGKNYIFGLIIVVMIIPSVALYIPNYMLISDLGMVKKFSGVIIPGIANAYGMFLMRQFFSIVPKSLVEACRIDGGSELRILRHVYLPICLPAVMALFIILFVGNWNDYQWPMLILQDPSTITLPLAVVRFHNEGVIELMPTAAACLISIGPVLLAYLFMQKQIVETFASSATKE